MQNNLQMAQKEEGEVGEEEEEVRRPYQVHQLHATSANPILEGKVHKLKKKKTSTMVLCVSSKNLPQIAGHKKQTSRRGFAASPSLPQVLSRPPQHDDALHPT
jgi:hypothetical protein